MLVGTGGFLRKKDVLEENHANKVTHDLRDLTGHLVLLSISECQLKTVPFVCAL